MFLAHRKPLLLWLFNYAEISRVPLRLFALAEFYICATLVAEKRKTYAPKAARVMMLSDFMVMKTSFE